MAKKYYDQLYKDLVLVDISKVAEKQVGVRWRTEQEVLLGKGDLICGNLSCNSKTNL